jgi:glycine hydroxymethyltransferase
VVAARKGYTESHTILLQTRELGDHHELANRLDQAGIIVNASRLPAELGGHGLRIGVQEITRHGARQGDMAAIAGFIHEVLKTGKPVSNVAEKVAEFMGGFQSLSFTFRGEELLNEQPAST